MYDKAFIYDAWSCRKGKGLLGAIKRTQEFLKYHVSCATHTHTHTHTHTRESHFPWIWKCDVRKFFDSVDQEILLKILSRRIQDSTTITLLKEIISSFTTIPGDRIGMPIGNLTSQIFANIYLNELDRFIKHKLKTKKYVRYGDDFIVIEADLKKLKNIRSQTVRFLADKLKLEINPKSDKIIKASHELKFLGVKLWPTGRNLNKRNIFRIKERLKPNNISSYSGLIKQHGSKKQIKRFNWMVYEKIINQ